MLPQTASATFYDARISSPGYLGDLHVFNPTSNTWTALNPSGNSISSRGDMGLTVPLNGMVYLFGGVGIGSVSNNAGETSLSLGCVHYTTFMLWDHNCSGFFSERLLGSRARGRS